MQATPTFATAVTTKPSTPRAAIASSPVLEPLQLGALRPPNRVVMAPMTRTRATAAGVPTPMMATYYAQRASAGLIIGEATAVANDSAGILRAPGLYNDAQVAGWRAVTAAVHQQGGRIVAQLWHGGRVSHPHLQPDGLPPLAPSAIAAEGSIFTPQGREAFVAPRVMRESDIQRAIAQFAAATTRARDAGFDGVELHGAFGYLVDQFLQDGSNTRQDGWGGSVAGRARFLFETVDAMAHAWSTDRIGVRLSPSNRFYGIHDSHTRATFGHAIEGLAGRGLMYLLLMEPNESDLARGTVQLREVVQSFRSLYRGGLIANGGFDRARADDVITHGRADAVSFGRPFIANPDLPARFAARAALATPDPASFYGEGNAGYTDYPSMDRH
jgi:N-ethylmaleimide reductase